MYTSRGKRERLDERRLLALTGMIRDCALKPKLIIPQSPNHAAN